MRYLDVLQAVDAGTVLLLGALVVVAAAVTATISFFLFTRTVRQGVRSAENVLTKATTTLGEAVTHVAHGATQVALPVGQGVGEVLNSIADRIRVKQSELNELKTRSIQLAQEVERLKGRRIDVTNITAQLRLGLIQVSQQYHSFKRATVGSTDATPVARATTTEYVGLQRASYHTNIGLDIDRMRFEMKDDGVILVEGLREVDVIGVKDLRTEELLAELRLLTAEGTVRAKNAEILMTDERLHSLANEHARELLREIQSSQSVQHLAGATAEFGLAFLQACLGAGRFKLVEARQPLEHGITFFELCQLANRRVADELEGVQAERRNMDMKSSELQAEVLQLLVQPASRSAPH